MSLAAFFKEYPYETQTIGHASRPDSKPVTEEDIDVQEKEKTDEDRGEDSPWRLILYNDDVHTFEEVIHQLMKALSCSIMEAEKIAFTVHSKGKAVVYEGSFEECFQKNAILQEIQLITEIKG